MLYQNRGYLDKIVRRLQRLCYSVEWTLLNAVHYGVPQNRARLFVVAHHGTFDFPKQTHGSNPVTAGQALGELAQSIPKGARFLTPSMDDYVARYEKASRCARPRDLHLDQPSRTVTCRNLKGATADMLRIRVADGRRRVTVREAARLQGFPDGFVFCGSEPSQFNQIGNAVPPLLAKALAVEVRRALHKERSAQRRMREAITRQPPSPPRTEAA